MSFFYRLVYLIGWLPWDNGLVPDELTQIVEGPSPLAAGRALDLGCGTGTQATYLACHGWRVTAIDAVEGALRRARGRAAASGIAVDWTRGDVTRLTEIGLEPGFSLFFDRGCFHGLNARERAGYASGVTELAAPGGTLLMMSFARNEVRGGPDGAEQSEIVETFAGWELVSAADDTGPAPEGPFRNVPRRWYRLRRMG